MEVLIGACIRQKPTILKEFLQSLDKLNKPFIFKYLFIKNNLCEEAEVVLNEWSKGKPVEMWTKYFKEEFVADEKTHHWNSGLVKNVAGMKDEIIFEAKKRKVDFLFLTDSDNCLQPETLSHLISTGKDIVGEICWTRWYPEDPLLPNAWFFHKYGFTQEGLNNLRKEELLKVGGFGGMALISKRALQAGVKYEPLESVDKEWGEDRSFALRANVLGFDLWIDTKYPMFHMYRESDLKKGKTSVLIAVPTLGTVRAELADKLIKIVKATKDISLDVLFNYGLPVDSNRNHIVRLFLATNNEWLLFIDSDIVPPENVLDLLNHGKKIVGAVCFTTTTDGLPYPVIMKRNENKIGFNVDRDVKPLMKVDATGASCLLIHREVFEKIPSPFRLGYDDNGMVTKIGEDFDFCLKAKQAGYGVWVDTTLQCSHFKEIDLRTFNKILEKEARK